LQRTLDAMRRRRRSVFFGTIFDEGGLAARPSGEPAPAGSLAVATGHLEGDAP
jgi:hypothetical protein